MPLPTYTPSMSDSNNYDGNELISQYFKQGYSNLEILQFLKLHDIAISLSTLKRPGWWIFFSKICKTWDYLMAPTIKNIFRQELYQVAEMWNQHQIASSKFGDSSGPRGKPDCMYFLPHLYNIEDFKVNIDLH